MSSHYYVHGLGQTQCFSKAGQCLHYQVDRNRPWPEFSSQLLRDFQKIPPRSTIYAYSLGGLLTLDILIKYPSIRDKIASLNLIAVPLLGSYVAPFCNTTLRKIIGTFFTLPQYLAFDQFMDSISPFSKECLSTYQGLKQLSNIEIFWFVGLGETPYIYGSYGDNDGVIDAALAHPVQCRVSIGKKVIATHNHANVSFCQHANHLDINQYISHWQAQKTWCQKTNFKQVWLFDHSDGVELIRFKSKNCEINVSQAANICINGKYYSAVNVPSDFLDSDVWLYRNYCWQVIPALPEKDRLSYPIIRYHEFLYHQEV